MAYPTARPVLRRVPFVCVFTAAELTNLERLDVSRNPLTSPPVEVAARGLDSVKR